MKRLANLRKELPKKSKLNSFQVKNLKGGADKNKRKVRASGTTASSTPNPGSFGSYTSSGG